MQRFQGPSKVTLTRENWMRRFKSNGVRAGCIAKHIQVLTIGQIARRRISKGEFFNRFPQTWKTV